ncbi:MAG: glycosyltransferase [Steroidobacter sp.]
MIAGPDRVFSAAARIECRPSRIVRRSAIPKKLLLIAYHFPPLQGSTGVHRTLAFAKYLQEYGWDVTVLTAHPRAYPRVSAENEEAVPAHVDVVRAFALDAQRHLSLFGRYPSALATPDRWQSWIVGGYFAGARLIRRWSPDAIMSTYPIASAHVIAARLQRTFKLPWIADLRDPMAQSDYPPDPRIREAYFRIEQDIVRQASRMTVTTAGTAALYRERYPQYPSDSIVVIPNGFDEAAFARLGGAPALQSSEPRRKLQLLHSGLLYPNERNPNAFFAAVAELCAEGRLSAEDVEFVFRGGGNEAAYRERLDCLRLNSIVKLLPSVPYAEALKEMQAADACMLFQASNCNQQIPAKVYEYLYCAKPILALTDPVGETGQLLASFRIKPVTPLDDKEKIKQALPAFIEALRQGRAAVPLRDQIMRYSRRDLTRCLAETLDKSIAQSRRTANA